MRLDDDVPAFHCSCCFVSKQNVLVHSISPQASHLAHLLIALFPPEMKFQALLWGSLLLSCCWPTGAAKDAPLSMKPSFMLKTFLGISQDTIAEEPQDMLVIGPGLGRTGTSSFITAMHRLGLKSYHMSGVMRTPGHLDKWLGYIQGDASADEVMDALSTAGFNATSSMPACYLYKDLMKRYPNARVVLTVRGDGDGMAWAKSVKGSIGLMRPVLERVPWKWIPAIRRFKVLFHWIFAQENVYWDESFEFDANDLAAMYNNWVAKIKASVPEEKLLVFAPKDGWRPLCDFLSPLNNEIEATCQEILESNEPYPRVNEKAQISRMVRVLNTVSTVFEWAPIALVVVSLFWLATRSGKKTKQA